MTFQGNADEVLQLETLTSQTNTVLSTYLQNGLTILWSLQDRTTMIVDGVYQTLRKDEFIFLTEFHKAELKAVEEIRLFRFNRPFYCIIDHDSEVGCKGILFFGASSLPVIRIPELEREKFEVLWTMFVMEMQSTDNLQMEMLQVLLKRLLILCTRIYKEQRGLCLLPSDRLGIIREFYYLVEKHFKEHRDVAFYASVLNRSSKTLSNLFAGNHHKTPLQVIHERILLEARRQLHYSEKSIKEIAYDLGYEDLQSFSRFFRTKEKIAPAQFRDISRNGKRGGISPI